MRLFFHIAHQEGKRVCDFSTRELRAACQKTAPNPEMETHVGLFTRIFSIYLTRFFLHTTITPNQITIMVVLLVWASAAVYFSSSYYVTLLGPIIYFISIIFDGADGETARFRRQTGRPGAGYAEPVSHDAQFGFFFSIIALGLFTQGASVYVLIVGAAASIFVLQFRLLTIRFWDKFYAGTERADKKEQQRIDKSRFVPLRIFYWSKRHLYGANGIFIPLALATIFARMDLFIYFYGASFALLYFTLLAKQLYLVPRFQKQTPGK